MRTPHLVCRIRERLGIKSLQSFRSSFSGRSPSISDSPVSTSPSVRLSEICRAGESSVSSRREVVPAWPSKKMVPTHISRSPTVYERSLTGMLGEVPNLTSQAAGVVRLGGDAGNLLGEGADAGVSGAVRAVLGNDRGLEPSERGRGSPWRSLMVPSVGGGISHQIGRAHV